MFEKTICKFKKPIGRGADRIVFYSRKHNCIFKMPNVNGARFSYIDYSEQVNREKRIFKKMKKKDFDFFPIINVMSHKDLYIVIMKKCICLKNLKSIVKLFGKDFQLDHEQDYFSLITLLNLTNDVDRFFEFKKRFRIRDLHLGNLGIYNNKLVILDAGY